MTDGRDSFTSRQVERNKALAGSRLWENVFSRIREFWRAIWRPIASDKRDGANCGTVGKNFRFLSDKLLEAAFSPATIHRWPTVVEPANHTTRTPGNQ